MRYRNFLAPVLGLALATVAAAQTPTTPQPATPRSDPAAPQPATTPYQPASQTPMNPPSTPSTPAYQDQASQREDAQEPMHRAPEMAFVQAHLDTVLQGVSLTYSQYRRIDSTAMRQIASAGFGRRGMGRDGMGRDGRSNNTNCGVNAQPGSSTMPGTATNCPPNQSGSGYPQRDTSATGSSSTYPQPGQQPGSSSYPNSGTTNQYDRGARGMGNDTLSTSDRSRLLPVLDQIDAAIRPVLSAAQQRTFDRNISTWKRNHSTATN